MDKTKPTRNASGHFPIMHSESGDADSFTGQTVNSFECVGFYGRNNSL